MLNFVIIKGVVSLILVTGVYKDKKPLNLSKKMRVQILLAPESASYNKIERNERNLLMESPFKFVLPLTGHWYVGF